MPHYSFPHHPMICLLSLALATAMPAARRRRLRMMWKWNYTREFPNYTNKFFHRTPQMMQASTTLPSGTTPAPAVLPHGDFLRAVLSDARRPRKLLDIHLRSAASRRSAHSDGRRSVHALETLPRPPDQAGRIGGHLRASGRSRRQQRPGGAQGGARRHAGTVTDSELMSDKAEAMLLAVHQAPRARCGLAWLSVTQGTVFLAECHSEDLADWIGRIAPSEVAYSAGASQRFEQTLYQMRSSGTLPYARWPLAPDWHF
ncbi:hypothetical protein FQA39_LY19362 [Lamprigera yunnana]|nr:hypothetical protein FQA39_LY19362 [Lamprigera yunnana]